MKIALVGNPNSGKTTLFNALTGKQEYVGNWAGVTVSKKEASLKKSFNKEAIVTDLPGAYSIRPFTSEESVTVDYIKEQHVDVIINVVDSTNLNRSLFFTTQILELGIPVVVALNKVDILKGNIDIKKLEDKIKCKVIQISASKEEGLEELIDDVYKESKNEEKLENIFKLEDIKDLKIQDKKRFKIVNEISKEVLTNNEYEQKETLEDKIDKFVINPIIGIPLFIVVMSFIFNLSINTLGPLIADNLVAIIQTFQESLKGILASNGVNDFLNELLTDGIIGGIGAVLGFVPLVMILMFLLALLEDCGFMARIAVIFDPIFKKIGLSGKSIIPMVVGYGCSIPGIMSARTIKTEKQRRMTILLTPFVPCGAKVPIIAFFTVAFFPDNPLLFPLVYLIAFTVIILVGLLMKKAMQVEDIKDYFIIELPSYRIPSAKRAFFRMLDTAKDFIKKAGTIILICNTVVFMMTSFDFSLNLVGEHIDNSILATIATPLSVLLIPIGIGTWQLTAAAITGFLAKEEVVGTLSIVYAMSGAINEDFELINSVVAKEAMGITQVVALSFMFFNLFTPPCFAAIGAMKSELKSNKVLLKGISLQIWVGYMVSMIVYQVGSILFYKKLGEGFLVAIILVVISLFGILSITRRTNNKNESMKLNIE